jgi:hypothetical protein
MATLGLFRAFFSFQYLMCARKPDASTEIVPLLAPARA